MQFCATSADLLRGDFGPSFQYKDFTVTELIAAGFPVSLQLGGLAMLLALLAGVSIGTLAALANRTPVPITSRWRGDDRYFDSEFRAGAVARCCVSPSRCAGCRPAGSAPGRTSCCRSSALALPQIAYIARLTRGSMIEVLRSDFHSHRARTGFADNARDIVVHALKPALVPIVSYLGPATAGIITGSVVIEQIFGVPGPGPIFRAGRAQPRLHARDGCRCVLRRADHLFQLSGRPCCTAGSTRG